MGIRLLGVGMQVVENMKQIYKHIDDVDLFIGGMSETRVEDALLGPTFLCLIGDQMARLRRGDRFFYEEETANFSQGESTPDFELIFSANPLERSNCVPHSYQLVDCI